MVTCVSITKTSKKANSEASKRSELQWVLCIYYLAQFNEFLIQVLINLSSEVNAIQPSFIKKLGFCIYKANIDAQKINSSRQKTFRMVIASFQIDNKDKKSCFFKLTFLLADISINIA